MTALQRRVAEGELVGGYCATCTIIYGSGSELRRGWIVNMDNEISELLILLHWASGAQSNVLDSRQKLMHGEGRKATRSAGATRTSAARLPDLCTRV
jgi:hypothetical protein